MNDEIIAYVDESMRTFGGKTTYYLCAVIDRGEGDAVTVGLRSLMPRGAKKLHWREMGVLL